MQPACHAAWQPSRERLPFAASIQAALCPCVRLRPGRSRMHAWQHAWSEPDLHASPSALCTPWWRPAETSLTTGLAAKTQDSQYTIGVASADGKVTAAGCSAGLRGSRPGCMLSRRWPPCDSVLSPPPPPRLSPAPCPHWYPRSLIWHPPSFLLAQTTVSGRYPGNSAGIQQNLAVCGSQVYVIDKASTLCCSCGWLFRLLCACCGSHVYVVHKASALARTSLACCFGVGGFRDSAPAGGGSWAQRHGSKQHLLHALTACSPLPPSNAGPHPRRLPGCHPCCLRRPRWHRRHATGALARALPGTLPLALAITLAVACALPLPGTRRRALSIPGTSHRPHLPVRRGSGHWLPAKLCGAAGAEWAGAEEHGHRRRRALYL